MKDTFYFSHDYNARNDIKIKRLIQKHGMAGYGLYWAIIEDLYQNANALPTDYETIAFDLRSDIDSIRSIVNDFDLFVVKDDIFGSLSVERRIEERSAKSEKARKSAYERWNKNANALQTHSDPNAIKERKGKEIKRNNKEQFDFSFADDDFLPTFKNWLEYKKKRNETYKTQQSVELAYKKLLNLSGNNPKIAREVTEQSMANNWAGLFELKTKNEDDIPNYLKRVAR